MTCRRQSRRQDSSIQTSGNVSCCGSVQEPRTESTDFEKAGKLVAPISSEEAQEALEDYE